MIASAPGTVPAKVPSGPKKAKPPTPSAPKAPKKKRGFFTGETVAVDFVSNEEAENARQHRIQTIVLWQSGAIFALTFMLACLVPFSKPIYHYYARDPSGANRRLDASNIPNLTNTAILAWATNSVTEVMTFGFGDILTQLNLQTPRFTPAGWTSFSTAFYKQKWNERFKQGRLVLTTVPSGAAVMLSQGTIEVGIYQWKVQVPVIMNYASNSDLGKPMREYITLTIERVSPQQNPVGIAIRNWISNG